MSTNYSESIILVADAIKGDAATVNTWVTDTKANDTELVFAGEGLFSITSILDPAKLQFTYDDFVFVENLYSSIFVMSADAGLNIKNINDLDAYAAGADEISVAANGATSSEAFLAAALFGSMGYGDKLKITPYSSAAEAAQATATLHGADEGSGDIAISSWADVVSGSSISVYKTQDFDAANPVYKVKTWDKSGNVTEQMVDVSKVDPENCDTAEMYAYTANLKESGKGSFEDTVLKAAVAKAVKNAEQRSVGSWSFSEKTDWVKIVNDIMQSEYQYGDLKCCMEWKKFLGFLEK